MNFRESVFLFSTYIRFLVETLVFQRDIFLTVHIHKITHGVGVGVSMEGDRRNRKMVVLTFYGM